MGQMASRQTARTARRRCRLWAWRPPSPVMMTSSPSSRNFLVWPFPSSMALVPFHDSSSMQPKLSGSFIARRGRSCHRHLHHSVSITVGGSDLVRTVVSKARGRGEAWEGVRDPTAPRDPALVGITLEMSSPGTLRALLTSFRIWALGGCWANLPRPILPGTCQAPAHSGGWGLPRCCYSWQPPPHPTPLLGRDFPSKRA